MASLTEMYSVAKAMQNDRLAADPLYSGTQAFASGVEKGPERAGKGIDRALKFMELNAKIEELKEKKRVNAEAEEGTRIGLAGVLGDDSLLTGEERTAIAEQDKLNKRSTSFDNLLKKGVSEGSGIRTEAGKITELFSRAKVSADGSFDEKLRSPMHQSEKDEVAIGVEAGKARKKLEAGKGTRSDLDYSVKIGGTTIKRKDISKRMKEDAYEKYNQGDRSADVMITLGFKKASSDKAAKVDTATKKALTVVGAYKSQKEALRALEDNRAQFEINGVDMDFVTEEIKRVLPEKYESSKDQERFFGKINPWDTPPLPKRVKDGISEEQRDDGKWYPVKEEIEGKGGEVTLPENITKASEAVSYLIQTFGMTEREAQTWVRTNAL